MKNDLGKEGRDPHPGDNLIAPDFNLPSSQSTPFSLHTLLESGPLILIFFPLAFSPDANNLLCLLRDNMKIYLSLGARVAAVGIDSHYTMRAYKETYNFNFPLLSDFNRKVCEEYGILREEYQGLERVPRKAAFLIDQDRKILYQEVQANNEDPFDFRTMLKKLRG